MRMVIDVVCVCPCVRVLACFSVCLCGLALIFVPHCVMIIVINDVIFLLLFELIYLSMVCLAVSASCTHFYCAFYCCNDDLYLW